MNKDKLEAALCTLRPYVPSWKTLVQIPPVYAALWEIGDGEEKDGGVNTLDCLIKLRGHERFGMGPAWPGMKSGGVPIIFIRAEAGGLKFGCPSMVFSAMSVP